MRLVALAGLLACAMLAACQRAPDLAPKAKPATPPVSAAPIAAVADVPLPADVFAFIAKRDQCDHFRGEEAYDEARGHFLSEQVAAKCAGTDAALARLRQKYVTTVTVMKALAGYDDQAE